MLLSDSRKCLQTWRTSGRRAHGVESWSFRSVGLASMTSIGSRSCWPKSRSVCWRVWENSMISVKNSSVNGLLVGCFVCRKLVLSGKNLQSSRRRSLLELYYLRICYCILGFGLLAFCNLSNSVSFSFETSFTTFIFRLMLKNHLRLLCFCGNSDHRWF